MIHSEPSASRPRNSRPVAPRRQPVLRRSAASRPDLVDASRWKVQLELAPEEIAFVYRKGLARGAEVCRRGSHDWRPLLTTPELHDALAKRASLAEMIEVAPPQGAALTLSQTLAITDPALAALYLAHRSAQAPVVSKSAPPPPLVSKSIPPPPLVSKSVPPPPLVSKSVPPPPLLSKSAPPPSLALTLTGPLPSFPPLKPLVNRDSVPDWEDTPLLPLRIEPARLPRQITLPSARALAQSADPVVVHARPAELSLAAAVAVLLTLVVTALTLKAEAPKLNELITNSVRAAHTHAEPARPAYLAEARLTAPSTIPVVYWHDLPVEGGRGVASVAPSQGRITGGAAQPAPTPPRPTPPAHMAGPNRASFARALNGAAGAARSCGDGPVNAQVVVTFGPSGVARNIHFAGAPPVALRSCVLNAVARTRVTPFEGEPVTVSKTLSW